MKICNLGNRAVNNWLIPGNDGYILIDTGYENGFRRFQRKLKKAGIVRVEAGIGGASLARDPSDITLLDIFNAVETDTDLFHFHENPNPECPVGRSVHPVLGEQLAGVQSAMERHLESITLKDLMSGIST